MSANTTTRPRNFAGADAGSIEHTNDQTRARLSGNLDTLQARLTPSQLVDQAVAYLRTDNGKRFTRNLGTSVRENPMPAAVTGIGLAWLMVSNGMRASGMRPGGPMHIHDRAHHAGMAITRRPDEAEHEHRARVDDARGTVLGVTRRQSEPADSYSSRISDAMDTAKSWAATMQSSASDSMGAASERMSSMGGQAGSSAQAMLGQARDGLASTIAGNPMLLGALGVTAGAVLGALLPHLDAEDALLGDAGRSVNSMAHDAIEGAMRKGEHVVDATTSAVQKAAGEQGLTPDEAANAGTDVAHRARTVAEAALEAGTGALKE